jgi:hypothetical protein
MRIRLGGHLRTTGSNRSPAFRIEVFIRGISRGQRRSHTRRPPASRVLPQLLSSPQVFPAIGALTISRWQQVGAFIFSRSLGGLPGMEVFRLRNFFGHNGRCPPTASCRGSASWPDASFSRFPAHSVRDPDLPGDRPTRPSEPQWSPRCDRFAWQIQRAAKVDPDGRLLVAGPFRLQPQN